ncbi:MAG: hypothetical protein KDC84_07215 [Crocinitomicaceae bacterium]|nr:hypothetical protein [Crocinitomicaceae bacterium]
MKTIYLGFLSLFLLFANSSFSQKFNGNADVDKLSTGARITAKLYANDFCNCGSKYKDQVKAVVNKLNELKKSKDAGEKATDEEKEALKKLMLDAKPYYECLSNSRVDEDEKLELEKEIKALYGIGDDKVVKYKSLIIAECMSDFCSGTDGLDFVFMASASASIAEQKAKK